MAEAGAGGVPLLGCYTDILRRVSSVSGVLSEEGGRVRASVGGRSVVVVTLSVVARVISRSLVWVASVILVVRVVVIAREEFLRRSEDDDERVSRRSWERMHCCHRR